jgi:hypothetical protein
VVVKGDTLWDISEKFLKDPWLWPEVWQLNKEQIKNPHLIYPGDVVILTMETASPGCRLESSASLEVVRLSPQVRSRSRSSPRRRVSPPSSPNTSSPMSIGGLAWSIRACWTPRRKSWERLMSAS